MPTFWPSLSKVTKFSLGEAAAITFEDEELTTTDHTYTGWDATMTAGEDLVLFSLCYFKNDGKFWRTDADVAGTTEGLLAIAGATIAANGSGKFILPNSFIRDDTWAWAVGGEIYASITAGAMSQTAPVGSGDQIRKVGIAISADVIWFSPDPTITEVT